ALKITTAWNLGVVNIGRALFYRLGLRLGWNPVKKIAADQPATPFFLPVSSRQMASDLPVPDFDIAGLSAFGLPAEYDLSNGVPDWHRSIITGGIAPRLPWWQIPDFVDGLGDIKGVWEASRFDWVLIFARQVAAGDDGA